MPAGKNALAGNKIRVSYKIKTRSRQFWDRLKGKFDNAFFLTRRKKERQEIKKRLSSIGFSFDDYYVRRKILTKIKRKFKQLVTQELQLESRPWFFSRVKTYKSIKDAIDNFSRKLKDPNLLDNREIQKIRQTVQASEKLSPKEKKEVLDKMNSLENTLKQIEKWSEELRKLEKQERRMKRGYYRDSDLKDLKKLKKDIDKARRYLNKAENAKKGQRLGEKLRKKLTESMTERVTLESLGLRIIAGSEKDVYKIKESLDKWVKDNKGIIRETKDYVRYPKYYADVSNTVPYRSIHVLYFLGANEVPIEIHLRTWKMQKEIDQIDRTRKKKFKRRFKSGAQIRKEI